MSSAKLFFVVNDDSSLICRLCGDELAYGKSTNWGTTSLFKHLATVHHFSQSNVESCAKAFSLRDSSASASSQRTLLESFPSATVAASPALEEAVLSLLCAERLPFSLVGSPRFTAVLSAARAEASRDRVNISLSHRTVFSRRVDERFRDAMARVSERLKPVRHRMSSTYDIWSNSHTGVGFLAILVSFIDDHWNFCVAPIAMEPFVAKSGSDTVFSARPLVEAAASSGSSSVLAPSSSSSSRPDVDLEAEAVRHDAINIQTAVVGALERVGVDGCNVQSMLAGTTDNAKAMWSRPRRMSWVFCRYPVWHIHWH